MRISPVKGEASPGALSYHRGTPGMHPPHPPVTIAVTGIGQRGLQHLHTLWSLQDRGLARIVALCDPYEDNLSEKKSGVSYPDTRRILSTHLPISTA